MPHLFLFGYPFSLLISQIAKIIEKPLGDLSIGTKDYKSLYR